LPVYFLSQPAPYKTAQILKNQPVPGLYSGQAGKVEEVKRELTAGKPQFSVSFSS